MPYERKTIDISRIHEQEDICRQIFDRVTADGQRPLAMVDTYGCQQNEADSEKLRGYLSEMGYSFTCANTRRCECSAMSARSTTRRRTSPAR